MARTFFNKTNVPRRAGSGRYQITFKLFGQWAETIDVINKLGPSIKAGSIKAQMKICQDIAKRVKKHIKLQDLNWQPLSEVYAERKAAAGLSGNTLEAYENYYNNITVWTVGTQGYVLVGVKKGLYTKNLSGRRSKYDIATIAAIHELSQGRKIPRRPLWNPTIAEMGGAPGLKAKFISHLVGALRVKGIPVKPFMNLKIK